MNMITRIVILSSFLFVSSVYAEFELVSVSSTGVQSNSSSGVTSTSNSADGRYVVFHSPANNLVNADTNNSSDIFVRDRNTALTERISLSSSGEQGDSSSFFATISADGRFVAFASNATNLVAGDTNNERDIFVRDREQNVTSRVNVSSAGEQALASGYWPSISADGRFVAFESSANNLVVDDTNNDVDVFVHDRDTGITERVSVSSTGIQASGQRPSISADGRYIAFESSANNLVMNDANSRTDVFIHDRDSGLTELISVSSSGAQGRSHSNLPSISADGNYVAFESYDGNLVAGDTNNRTDVFIRDRKNGSTVRISVPTTGPGEDPSISADGRFVVIKSNSNVYAYDSITKEIKQIDVLSSGEPVDGFTRSPSISADGRFVAFESPANNLVDNDSNAVGLIDIFLTENPLVDSNSDLISLEKLINNSVRETLDTAAQLATGTQYRQSYKVTNNSPNRIHQVQVFEGGQLVCNLYSLNPGESKQRYKCASNETVLPGNNNVPATVIARVSGSGEELTVQTNAYYKGFSNVPGKLKLTHYVNNRNADTQDKAVAVNGNQAEVVFRVENTGPIELYRVYTFHDPASPINSGWQRQCFIGTLVPGQMRYCKRTVSVTHEGLNKAFGRALGRNANVSATGVVNASNPTYFNVVLP